MNLTQFLTNTSGKIRPFAKRAPKPKPPPAPANVVDLFHSWAVTLFDDVLNIAVGVDGPLNINKIMNLLTNDTGMVVFDKLNGVNTTFNISDLANLTVGVKEASIGGTSSTNPYKVYLSTLSIACAGCGRYAMKALLFLLSSLVLPMGCRAGHMGRL